MRPIVLDTDASSLLLKRRLPVTLAIKMIDAQLVITFVTRPSWPSGPRCVTGACATGNYWPTGWPGYRYCPAMRTSPIPTGCSLPRR